MREREWTSLLAAPEKRGLFLRQDCLFSQASKNLPPMACRAGVNTEECFTSFSQMCLYFTEWCTKKYKICFLPRQKEGFIFLLVFFPLVDFQAICSKLLRLQLNSHNDSARLFASAVDVDGGIYRVNSRMACKVEVLKLPVFAAMSQ